MRTFVFYLEDDRSAEPTVRRASVRDEFAARALAERMLRESYHHRSIEVREGDRRIFLLEPHET